MKIGVLGTGVVGKTLAGKLVELGHEVMLGSRDPGREQIHTWLAAAGERASAGTYAEAARFGELLINCTAGTGSLEALGSCDAKDLAGKVLMDVANPLDFWDGMPPSLFTPSDDSLGERIQRAYPEAKVVKALNTINAELMVDPSRVPGDHDLIIAGNDEEAKRRVRELIESFGWLAERIFDLGDISGARATEMYVGFWTRVSEALRTGIFNIEIER